MQLAKYRHGEIEGVGRLEADQLIPLDLSGSDCSSLSDILESDQPATVAEALQQRDAAIPLGEVQLLAPIDQQEVWAAGVTYKRSQTARMEESEASASCYDLVYKSDRPELFLKALGECFVKRRKHVSAGQPAWNTRLGSGVGLTPTLTEPGFAARVFVELWVLCGPDR